MENVGSAPQLVIEDEECENLFITTSKRNDDGLYEVHISFTEDFEDLGTKSFALDRKAFIKI